MMKHASQTREDDPNYYSHEPETLKTKSDVRSFIVGNGEDIYSRLQSAIESAESEIILITCFWAHSPSLISLGTSLKLLSDKSIQRGVRVKVFIGFSSLSIFQKIFQTASLQGRSYKPLEWTKKLGLPSPLELPGLDMEIKSIFVRPFSVMHPKFLIIDRKEVWLPSCNVSWESWFEGCIVLSGPVVHQFLQFWHYFWLRTRGEIKAPEESPAGTFSTPERAATPFGAAHCHENLHENYPSVYTVFLPSPHHVNPSFRPWPWIRAHPPPPTPLNCFILDLFSSAVSSIYIQTPNLTTPPVLSAILKALQRGVDVHIVTSERLMILEQLVTAGTTTARCVKKLIKRYKSFTSSMPLPDEEVALQSRIGKLIIEYFTPKEGGARGEPQQSHLKLTIVDQQWTILGSGNMDRASWYTSQELGVAFLSKDLAKDIRNVVDEQLIGRKRFVFGKV
ncbi:phospholipase D/nuclease [Tothia fuscella]|uniref:Phospholipase D/nuclease n=1 Tax=Tothia fuscella TaxID=1048955 RepID=A0A9P4U2K5_9PEZI|nr:phospholipase D/nuclease [Tothia fuscella]